MIAALRIRTALLALVLLLASGMGAAETAAPMPDPLAGRDGVWIRGAGAVAFVSALPRPQVLVFRRPDGPSPLLIADHAYIGARGLFMERGKPTAWDNFRAAQQPGTVVETQPRRVRVEAAVDAEAQVQYLLEAEVDAQRPLLRLRHGYRNCATTARTLAGWSLTSVAQSGTVVVPWGVTTGEDARTLTLFSGTRADEPGIELGRRALAFALAPAEPSTKASIKIGIHSPAGWAALVRDDLVLRIASPYDADGIRPEGGSNITIYKSWDADPAQGKGLWAEIEHVGAFRSVPPGDVVWIAETQELLPPLADGGPGADALLDRLERLPETPTP